MDFVIEADNGYIQSCVLTSLIKRLKKRFREKGENAAKQHFTPVFYTLPKTIFLFFNCLLHRYFLTHQQQTAFENIVGKGEIACNKQFLLFPQYFLLHQIICLYF